MSDTVPLESWQTFYVIVGSAGGALTGIMFVVIALVSGRRTPGARDAARAFSSPTVVHFGVVMGLSAILSMPNHTPATLGNVVSPAIVKMNTNPAVG